ncbi:XdhC family protein [Micromonospora sp. CA-240977]|uniref:XdhC family protein n=1 Tax=Micromonospora sp. CA-240977 TaxID=3239957 RepID=UPI003D90DCF5
MQGPATRRDGRAGRVRDVFDEVHRRWRTGEAVALATVVATWRSAPQPPGAAMLVAADGTVTGSVSGACVEADLYERARGVLDTGTPELTRYGVSDDAYAVGLTGGGVLDVFVERVDADGSPSSTRSPPRAGPAAPRRWSPASRRTPATRRARRCRPTRRGGWVGGAAGSARGADRGPSGRVARQ